MNSNLHLLVTPKGAPAYKVFLEKKWNENLLSSLLFKYNNIFIITQKNIKDLYLDDLIKCSGISVPANHIIEIENGETAKHISGLLEVYNHLTDVGIDRHSCILALGGGVVGDFAGFVASTVLRGVSFVQFPTTLLACVDSSVGGKVAVNIDRGKNMVGSFYQPDFVYCNLLAFETLETSEWNCGFAEMCKHAFLDSSGGIFSYMTSHLNQLKDAKSQELMQAVYESACFKASIVDQDEKETGLRAILNLGHTVAHALESLTSYQKFSHGEAVSRGLVTALLLSQKINDVSEGLIESYLDLLVNLGLPCDTANFTAEEILEHMKYDKKSVSGIPRFVLLGKDKEAAYGFEIKDQEFQNIWARQKQRFG